MLNMLSQVPVHPIGFATVCVDVVSLVSSVSSVLCSDLMFMVRKHLFIPGLQLDWLLLELLMAGNQFMIVLDWKMDADVIE